MSIRRIKFVPPITLVLVLYLLLFSSFALFHTYANSELEETSCLIGHSVLLGQVALLGLYLLSVILIRVSDPRSGPELLIRNRIPSSNIARAPPRLSFL